MHNFFEEMRRANLDFYTANPLENLDEKTLARLAEESGMTVEELQAHMTQPHLEMTCPLCGLPSTHLVNCKGCGGDAWGSEYLMAHGQDVHARLKATYKAALTNEEPLEPLKEHMEQELPVFSLAQVEYATTHAYSWGGCMICSTCWNHTLPVEAFRTCPLKMLGDLALNASSPQVLVEVMLSFPTADEDAHKERVFEWIRRTFAYWTVIWNTVESDQDRLTVGIWRFLLLKGVWN